MMHPPSFDSRNQRKDGHKVKGSAAGAEVPPIAMNLCTSVDLHRKISIYSKTVKVEVRLKGSEKSYFCYCIIDEQSNTSLVDPLILQYFSVEAPEVTYKMTTLSGFKTNVSGQIVAGFEVRGVGESKWIKLPNFFSNNPIPNTKFEIATDDVVQRHPHISHLAKHFPGAIDDNCEIMLLIGSNCGPAMYTEQFGNHAPFVHHTALGWAVVGPVCSQSSNSEHVVLKTNFEGEHFNAKLNFDNRKFNLPNLKSVLLDDEMLGLSRSDMKFLEIMSNSVTVNKLGNLQFDLPLRENCIFFNNRDPVYKRTFNTLNRLKRDSVKLDQCLSVMGGYLAAGHVREIPTNELKFVPGHVWYLPVFPVEHPKKKKCRLVFDSSAVYNDNSPYKNLHQGPDRNNNLVGVLMRFRQQEVGFSCDVQNMFHNFYVNSVHANFLRFYWFSNNDTSNSLSEFQAMVHIFGNSSSPAVSNYGLNYAATHSPHSAPASSREFLAECMYVDDGLGSAGTSCEALAILNGARQLLSHYNIRLHKINSNKLEVTSSFPDSEISEEAKWISATNNGTASTLGLLWDTKSDCLSLRSEHKPKPFTKRGILSVNGSNFDPLGISSPVTLGGKLFQRKVLPSKSKGQGSWSEFDWDDILPDLHKTEWYSWISGLNELSKLNFPRCYVPENFGKVQKRTVHVFSDASKDALCFVSYIQSINEKQDFPPAFLFANSKVAPKMANTIPRMELNAAVEAALAVRKIASELRICMSDIFYYTDSNIVLGYLKNTEKRFKRYITRRIELILSCGDKSQWSYVSTETNPADKGTRPHSPEQLLSTNWLTGPEFLCTGEYPTDSLPAVEGFAGGI